MKNNFWLYSLVFLLIMGFAFNWNMYIKIAVVLNASVVLFEAVTGMVRLLRGAK